MTISTAFRVQADVLLGCALVLLPTLAGAQAPAATPAPTSPTVAGAPGTVVAMTVAEAMERAVANSHRIEEGSARQAAAAAAVEQRHAAQLPRINAQAGYTRTNHVDQFGILLPNNQLRIIYPDIPDNYRSRLDAQWPLYTGGRLPALERAAKTEAEATTLDVDAIRADLRAEAARVYWTLVSQGESLRVLDRSIAQLDAHLRDARNRLDAGLIPPNEVLSVEAQQARQRMLRVQVDGAREVSEAALARLVGLPAGTAIRPTESAELPPDAVANGTARDTTDPLPALLQAARDNRADRAAIAGRATAATDRVAAAAAGHRPTVGVGAGIDYARPNPRIFPRMGEFRTSWDASINVDWPLFDGGRADAELAEATAARRALDARLAEFDSLLALEIRQRLSDMAASRAAVTSAEAAIAAATEAHRVLGERFNAGVATSTDVLDAELAILQAQLDRTQAITGYRIAAAGLARATGR